MQDVRTNFSQPFVDPSPLYLLTLLPFRWDRTTLDKKLEKKPSDMQARVEARRIHKKKYSRKRKGAVSRLSNDREHNNFRDIKVGRQVREPQDPRKRKQIESPAKTNWWREAAAFKLEICSIPPDPSLLPLLLRRIYQPCGKYPEKRNDWPRCDVVVHI